jgi:hypothetical protein
LSGNRGYQLELLILNYEMQQRMDLSKLNKAFNMDCVERVVKEKNKNQASEGRAIN